MSWVPTLLPLVRMVAEGPAGGMIKKIKPTHPENSVDIVLCRSQPPIYKWNVEIIDRSR